jgi:hypothetical protein
VPVLSIPTWSYLLYTDFWTQNAKPHNIQNIFPSLLLFSKYITNLPLSNKSDKALFQPPIIPSNHPPPHFHHIICYLSFHPSCILLWTFLTPSFSNNGRLYIIQKQLSFFPPYQTPYSFNNTFTYHSPQFITFLSFTTNVPHSQLLPFLLFPGTYSPRHHWRPQQGEWLDAEKSNCSFKRTGYYGPNRFVYQPLTSALSQIRKIIGLW